jgi:hypothetical protein
MLPDLSTVRSEVETHLQEHLQQRLKTEWGLLYEIGFSMYHEGDDSSSSDQEGKDIPTQWFQASSKIEVKYAEIDSLSLTDLKSRFDNIAKDIALQKSKSFFSFLDKALVGAGQVVKSSGNPISAEDWMKGLEQISIEFDGRNRPILPTITCSPEQAARLREELQRAEKDVDFVQKFNNLMLQKRVAFHDRETNRKLVD